jgi:serine kinase of HPr protein (carbohydrate metabolism regulator)
VIRHAGLVARRVGGRWCGALIEGASGAGKSDLALRAASAGFRLVADDRTLVWISGARLYGRAPQTLAGLIEARGLGVVRQSAIGFAEIGLVVACVTDPDEVERLPDPSFERILGAPVPRLALVAREDSALAKLQHAMDHLGALRQQAYQASPRGGKAVQGLGTRK